MTGVWVVLAVGCLAFIATNVDGFLVLLVFFSDRRYATRQAIIGQYLGLSVLIAAFVAASLLALVIRLVPVPRGSQRPSHSARMIPPPRCAGSKAVRMARDGERKAEGKVRQTSPTSLWRWRARSRRETTRPCANSSIQRWASAKRVMSFLSGNEHRPVAALMTSFVSTPRRWTTRLNSSSASNDQGYDPRRTAGQ